MRLLYIITLAKHGGAQTHVRTLLEQMRQRAEITLATSCEGWLTDEARSLGVAVHLVPELVQSISLLKDIRATYALRQLCHNLQPDLVHLHSSKSGLLGRIAAYLAGIPIVFTAHGWAFTEGASYSRRCLALWSEQLTAPLANRIIAVSEYDRLLAQHYKVGHVKQIVTIHNGVIDTQELGITPTQTIFRLVMVARFSVQKDHITLLKAVARIPNIHLSLVGSGELLPKVKTLAINLGISERVEFLGDRSDIPEILAKHHSFTLISNYEGFPVSILEAMRASLPVIASNIGGIKEAVLDGVTGRLVPRGDVTALACVLAELANNSNIRMQMGEAGRQRFLDHFTSEYMLDKTYAIYKEVLAEKKSQSRL